MKEKKDTDEQYRRIFHIAWFISTSSASIFKEADKVLASCKQDEKKHIHVSESGNCLHD